MDKLLRFGEGKILRQLRDIASQVGSIEDDFVAMSDDELRGQTADFRSRYDKGETLESLLPEAFATVREASKRVLGKRHYDVQVQGDTNAPLSECIATQVSGLSGSNANGRSGVPAGSTVYVTVSCDDGQDE